MMSTTPEFARFASPSRFSSSRFSSPSRFSSCFRSLRAAAWLSPPAAAAAPTTHLMGVTPPLPLPPPPLSHSPSPTPAGEAITAAASPPPLSPRSPDDHITSSTLYETTSVRLSPHREHALCSPHNPPVRLSESSRATSRISHHPNNHCQHLELFRLLTAKEEVVFDYRVKCTASLIPVRMTHRTSDTIAPEGGGRGSETGE